MLYAVCPRCGRGILDHSLRVVSADEARSMIEARTPTDVELRALRRMELALRDFLPHYDHHPRWYWSPPTSRLAEEVRRVLSDLDESRRGRGAPPVVVTPAPDLDEEEGEDGEGEGRGGNADGEEGDDDEDFEGDEYEDDSDDEGPWPTAMSDIPPQACMDPAAFWRAAWLAYVAGLCCLALWWAGRDARRRAAIAELRLRRTRERLRTAVAELQEADEYLAATGELLECYEDAYGPLPFNPFAPAPSGEEAGDEWPEELGEVVHREE